MYKLVLEKAEELKIKLPTLVRSQKKLENSRKKKKQKTSFCFIDYSEAFDCVDNNKMENSTRDGNTRSLYLPPVRNLYAGQEATVRIRHGSTDWFQIGQGVH